MSALAEVLNDPSRQAVMPTFKQVRCAHLSFSPVHLITGGVVEGFGREVQVGFKFLYLVFSAADGNLIVSIVLP